MHNRSSLTPQRLILLVAALTIAILAAVAWTSPPASAAPGAQILPTAEACAPAILEPSSTVINARFGPGPNYGITAELYEGQSYPVAGRHHGFRWWAVTLPDGQTGWVWDNIVSVSGNVEAVPPLEAPLLNGIIPDTSDNWTPLSASPPCAPEPTPAPLPATTPESSAGSINALAAQDDDGTTDPNWSAPVNLSDGGGASNPALTAAGNGRYRVYWDDAFLGNFFVEGNHQSWSDPISTTVPFSGTVPLLLGYNGQTVALWRDAEDGALNVSNLLETEAVPEANWSAPTILDDNVLVLDALVDANGLIHLIYSRSTYTPSRNAGVYYTRSEDQGLTWSQPFLLFDSPYFRSLRAQDSHITLEASVEGGNVTLYAAWDIRTRKRIYFSRSTDGGQSWGAAVEISGPESTSNIILPFNLQIGASGSDVLLVWQIGQPATACQLYYQWSSDYGATWTQRQQIDEMLPGAATCPRVNQLLQSSELYYLLSSFPEQSFLLAWDGEQWSEPQAQRPINQFNNPETLNTVNLGCLQSAITPDNNLYIAGCDITSLDTNQSDIWFLSRSLGSTADWFPADDEWSGASAITEGSLDPHFPQLVSDSASVTHVLWAQQGSPTAPLNTVYHSQWDGAVWTQTSQILNSSDAISHLQAITNSQSERVYLLWTTTAGEMQLTHAQAGQLQASTDWAPPVTLPLTMNAAAAPALAVDEAGTLYLAYTISINEQRGVYLLTSADNGQSWSESRQIFDAEAAGWEIVGAPALSIAPGGALHLTFDQRRWTVDAGSVSTGLYYIQCAQPDADCSSPQLAAESQILWNDIEALNQSVIHRLWQSRSDDSIALQHQISSDGGATWSRSNVLVTGAANGPTGAAAFAVDPDGRLFAFSTIGGFLQSWIWENDIWRPDQDLRRRLSSLVEQELSAAVSIRGELMATFVDERPLPLVQPEEVSEGPQYALLAIERMISPPSPSPTATVTVTVEATLEGGGGATGSVPTPPPPATEDAATNDDATPETEGAPVTPVATFPSDTAQEGGSAIPFLDSANPLSFLILGVAPVLLVVIIALVIGLRRSSQRRR